MSRPYLTSYGSRISSVTYPDLKEVKILGIPNIFATRIFSGSRPTLKSSGSRISSVYRPYLTFRGSRISSATRHVLKELKNLSIPKIFRNPEHFRNSDIFWTSSHLEIFEVFDIFGIPTLFNILWIPDIFSDPSRFHGIKDTWDPENIPQYRIFSRHKYLLDPVPP